MQKEGFFEPKRYASCIGLSEPARQGVSRCWRPVSDPRRHAVCENNVVFDSGYGIKATGDVNSVGVEMPCSRVILRDNVAFDNLASPITVSSVGDRNHPMVKKPVSKAPRNFRWLRELCRAHSMFDARRGVQVHGRLNAKYRRRGISTPGGRVYSPRERTQLESTLWNS